MSVEATQWVIEQASVPGSLFAVLVCLGWKADDNGEGAYPSVPTLAAWTGKTDRQVRSDLRALEAAALIRLGDQSLAEHIRADRRPVVWDLAMPPTTGSTRPEVERMHDLKPASANKSLKEKPSKTSPSRKREEYDDPAFGEFWTAYPNKVGKRDAWAKWQAALNRGTDPAEIVKAALRYADERTGQPPKYTAHPATWLHQGRYDDEAAPELPADEEDEWWLR